MPRAQPSVKVGGGGTCAPVTYGVGATEYGTAAAADVTINAVDKKLFQRRKQFITTVLDSADQITHNSKKCLRSSVPRCPARTGGGHTSPAR